MLKKIGGKNDMSGAEIAVRDAKFPEPFRSGLEYNAPSRGTWNIVHTGMLIPESHQIFACAQGCLRGVILTAAEMNAMDRMSWISVCENDMFDGSMEQDIIDGCTDILNKMPVKPRAVLLFLSCIHYFAGCDVEMINRRLSTVFPDVEFIDCYMNPTMRKSGLTPDQIMRKQLYKPLQPLPQNSRSVNIIGCDRATDSESELVKMVKSGGFTIRDITACKSYDEYLQMGESAYNITYIPTAAASGEELERRLGQKHFYLPLCYDYGEIEAKLHSLADGLSLAEPDYAVLRERADSALSRARFAVGAMPVAIDYTAVPRPLGLARTLIEHGFNVKYVYADSFSAEEKRDFEWLRDNSPQVMLCATVNAKMRFQGSAEHTEKYLAIGQKAAYFCGTDSFVNIVSGGGFYGFEGIVKLAARIEDACANPKDRRTVIQLKGLGCESCL